MLAPLNRLASKQGPTGASRDLATLAVLIPAWQPEAMLIHLCRGLVRRGFGVVATVDDGSGYGYQPIFAEVAGLPGAKVLTHTLNEGKGRALKTGFHHLFAAHPEIAGVITADADGQHAPEDIERVARALLRNPRRPVLGSRRFAESVPLRSRIGNRLTRLIFSFLTGTRLADTQTGLRALPRELLPQLLSLRGQRYEYEMTMLAHFCRSGQVPDEVPIATIYLENNRGSHFHPLRDSLRIYFVLLRLSATSLLDAGVDLAVFSICFALTHRLLLSVSLGRLSSLVNNSMNHRLTAGNRAPASGSSTRSVFRVAAMVALSYPLILLLQRKAHWNVFVAKGGVDALLSVAAFAAQPTAVVRRGEPL